MDAEGRVLAVALDAEPRDDWLPFVRFSTESETIRFSAARSSSHRVPHVAFSAPLKSREPSPDVYTVRLGKPHGVACLDAERLVVAAVVLRGCQHAVQARRVPVYPAMSDAASLRWTCRPTSAPMPGGSAAKGSVRRSCDFRSDSRADAAATRHGRARQPPTSARFSPTDNSPLMCRPGSTSTAAAWLMSFCASAPKCFASASSTSRARCPWRRTDAPSNRTRA